MPQQDLLKSLESGEIPKKVRMLIAGGMVPVPPEEMIKLLINLLKDPDPEIVSRSSQTLAAWDEEEMVAQLKNRDCIPALMEYYAAVQCSDHILQAIIANPSAPERVISSLASRVPVRVLESILDNRTRILGYPQILENIRRNPSATPEILRIVQEIEFEFLGDKKSTYSIETPDEAAPSAPQLSELELETASIRSKTSEFELDFVPEDLTLEGLPIDEEERQAAIFQRLSSMPVREKIRHALFGNREIRAVLVRDTNKQVARSVLRSPKITGNEIESISSMRSVADDILREIGNSREWTKSYSVVQNLVKNPKTPPIIAQRLLFRLRKQDLTYLSRDRSISEAVRHGAIRLLKQRTTAGQTP